MNILICDDDKHYVDTIRKYVDEFFVERKITDYMVYEYYSGEEAAKNTKKIDIAFLDVEIDRKSTRLNSSHPTTSRMPSSA